MHGPHGEIEIVGKSDAVSRIHEWLRDGATPDELAFVLSLFWEGGDTGYTGGVCVTDGLIESAAYCNGVPVAESE